MNEIYYTLSKYENRFSILSLNIQSFSSKFGIAIYTELKKKFLMPCVYSLN